MRRTTVSNGMGAFNLPPGAQLQHVQLASDEQRREVETVRAMQVRTASADQATKLLAGKAPSLDRWLKVAQCIENYILGLPQTEVPLATAGRPTVR
jgi:hypothetical protein